MDGVKHFLNGQGGKTLRDYLLKKLYELRDIRNLKELDTPTHQVLELKAAKKAFLKLVQVYEGILTMSEEEKSKDPRDSFDIV